MAVADRKRNISTLKSAPHADCLFNGSATATHFLQVFLALQTTHTKETAWAQFVDAFGRTFQIINPRLVYKVGALTGTLTVNDATVVRNDDDAVEFLTIAGNKDWNYHISNNTLTVAIQLEINRAQVEFQLEGLPQIDPAVFDQVLLFTRFFLNHFLQILRIDNYQIHSIKDDITLAFNQKYLKEFLANEIERCKRYAPSFFSIVFFDLDHLKAVNENHGHLVGTAVLKEVAALLRSQIRTSDFLARFGGDEFVIVLLKTHPKDAALVCRRIRSRLNAAMFLTERGLNIKMSGCFGIASFPKDGDTVDDLIKNADAAMYDVKHSGKNGIKIYEGA